MEAWLIDAGHGGKDAGAENSIATEKSLNLTVALEVARLLEDHGEAVILTRDRDVYVDINARTALANKHKCKAVISIHHNGGGGDGAEAIHSIFVGDGKRLADLIIAEFAAIGQNIRRVYSKEYVKPNGTKTDYFGMIRQTNMPTVITEFGFMDNPADFAQFDEQQELMLEAEAIARACLTYVGKSFRDGLDQTLALVAKNGYINSPDYWLGVLRGTTPVNLDYLKKLFENLAR